MHPCKSELNTKFKAKNKNQLEVKAPNFSFKWIVELQQHVMVRAGNELS